MPHDLMPYELRASSELDSTAHTVLPVSILPKPDQAVLLRFDGACPGCGGRMNIDYPLIGWVEGVREADSRSVSDLADALGDAFGTAHGDVEASLRCTCGGQHKDHPDDDLGCGARFTIRVKWGTP